MPIKGLTERERFPRLGKIHLGIRHPEKGYPIKTDYFVLPKDNPAYNELVKIFGAEPKELRVMIPAEDEELWASQYLKAYDQTHGLVCKGDGVTATRLVDVKTQKWPAKDAVNTTMLDMPCAGFDCPEYKAKKCGAQMNLQMIIPEVPGLGVWQIDTGSKNSIININSCAKIIRKYFGRLSRIPLTLSLEPGKGKDDRGKQTTIYVLNLRANVTLAELATSAKAIDKSLLLTSPEFEAQLTEQTERDIEELWGEKPAVDVTTGEITEGKAEKSQPKTEPSSQPNTSDAKKRAGKAEIGSSVLAGEASAVDEVPDRLVTQDEISNIYVILAERQKEIADLGKWIREQKWAEKNLKDLTLTKYNIILKEFSKSLQEG